MGFKFEHDFASSIDTTLLGVIVYKDLNGDLFLKSDLFNKQICIGYNYNPFTSSAFHSFEMLYDFNGKVKGINGMPLTFLYCG